VFIKTKAVIVNSPFQASFDEVILSVPQNHNLIVQIELCGICTPEQRVFKGTSDKNYPYWGGHELFGNIIEVLNPTSKFKVGDRIAVSLMDRCGVCKFCLSGLDNHCAYVNPVHPYADNYSGPRGFSCFLSIPEAKAFSLSDSLPSKYAALIEPVACVMRSIKSSNPKNNNIGVVGAGTMGLIHAVILKSFGYNVFIFESRAEDLTKAEKAAISGICEISSLCKEKIMEVTKSEGISAFFCTRYGVKSINDAIKSVNRGGDVILYQSISTENNITIDANFVHYNEISVKGTIAQTKTDFLDSIKYMQEKFEVFDCLTIEKIPASNPKSAFNKALDLSINRVQMDFRDNGIYYR